MSGRSWIVGTERAKVNPRLVLLTEEKEAMRVGVDEQVEKDTLNVVSLFGGMNLGQELVMSDPLSDLLTEGELLEDELHEKIEFKVRNVVDENQFPDQAMFVLDQQLKSLKSSLKRISFYMDDVEDLLPR